MFSDRRRVMLGGAVAALVVAIWAMWPASPPPAAVTRPARAARQSAQAAAAGPVAPVKMEALTADRQEPSDMARNPFRYQERVAPPPPRVVAPPPALVEAPPRPAAPPGPPPLPPIPLKFIGVVERANGVKWAVLSDGRGTLHGKDGDIIDGRYRIVKIGAESIELTYLDGRGRQVLRLTGQ